MHSSVASLGSALFERNQSRPLAKARPLSLPRESSLESFRQRNALLDWLFYDVKNVTVDEAKDMAPWLAAEGAVVMVPPSGAGPAVRCKSVEEFAARYGSVVRVMTVAGVGSSALGAVAFGRNVADALDQPVAAVVSGYGFADVIAEGLGGFFLFGLLNSVRHNFEWLDRLRERGIIQDPAASITASDGGTVENTVQTSKDTVTVEALLMDKKTNFSVLIGHSKGNLILSEALFGLKRTAPQQLKKLSGSVQIVTVSAKVAMPVDFNGEQVIDIIGQLDGFGALNSRPDIPTDVRVPLAWHHTNTDLALHLPVTSTLRAMRTQINA
jgi:hypothetical protein